jgi:hypothetical protein
MDLDSFLGKVTLYANKIDIGRKGFATDGEEYAGRIHYEERRVSPGLLPKTPKGRYAKNKGDTYAAVKNHDPGGKT